ncbi:MAG: phospholipid carrier-dependent glycosyltransferase [Thermoanaerobaculia bacterium]
MNIRNESIPNDAAAPLSIRWLRGLLLAALFLLVVEPGRIPLFEPDEGRYAEIPREMLATGDLVSPRLNGVLYFEKPPLFYWSVAASFKLLGLNEFAARVPTKLASAGLVLLTYLFARRRNGERVALLASLILATSTLVFALARITIIDPSLSLALAAAAFAFAAFQEHEASGDRKRAKRALYLLHISCAAAVMLKGLIGIVLPGGAILIWALLVGRLRIVPRLFSPGPLTLFLALVVPWHVLVAWRNPDFLNFYFIHEHFDRFAKREHRREGSSLYFVAVILGGFLPWTAFLPRLAETWPGRRLAAWRKRPTEAFLWIWALLVFLFFSASHSKLIPYIEPIWPAIALLLALGMETARERGVTFRAERAVSAFLFGALLLAGALYAFPGGYAAQFGIRPFVPVVLGGLLLGCVLLQLRSARFGSLGQTPAAITVPWLIFLAGAVAAFPAVARAITPWFLVTSVQRELKSGDLLVQRGHYLEVIPFYTRRLTPVSALGWSELDFGREHLVPERRAELFPGEPDFQRLWNGPERVLAIVHRDHVKNWGDPSKPLAGAYELGREGNAKHFLFGNKQ